MRVVITCGPAIAPIDRVRRLTNFSTGELGILLANAMATAGYEVICLKSETATTSIAVRDCVKLFLFSTNEDLAKKLATIASADAVFHAAALCDYDIQDVRDENGHRIIDAKISSRSGGLTIRLQPARKILPRLRIQFPNARIVGWKYELNGERKDALAAAQKQLAETHEDLCVLNGMAYGTGFGLVAPDGSLKCISDKHALCAALVQWCAS